MRTALIYGVIAAFIGWVMMYLDTRLLDNPKTKQTYCKNIGLIGGIVAWGIWMIGEEHFDDIVNMGGFKMGGRGMSGGMGFDEYLGEEIMTGSPNF